MRSFIICVVHHIVLWVIRSGRLRYARHVACMEKCYKCFRKSIF